MRTAKSCGSGAAVLALRPREATLLRDNGGKRAVLRGEHEVSRKAIAQGRPECFALPCMLVCSFVSANRTRDRGCSKHPVFPVPSVFEEGKRDANLGRNAPRARSHTLYRDCLHAGRPCERRDPYAAADVVLPRRSTTFVQQWATVAIGPCVRRDDRTAATMYRAASLQKLEV